MFALIALFTALADETTGPETCVLERYDSAHCELCTGAYYDDPTFCSATLSATRELACQTQGASVWDEIWCDSGYTDPIADTTDDTKECAAVGGATGGLAMLVGVVAVLMGRRRG